MTRTLRLVVVVAVTLATTITMPSALRADQSAPVRSGTILGWGYTWPAMFNGSARDCQWSEWMAGGNPECMAWLKSGCNPDLAGRNPALTSSIVELGELADGSTPRVFEWETDPYLARTVAGTDFGGAVVQLWTVDCVEIRSSIWRSGNGYQSRRLDRTRTTFTIPSSARWMTVTTNDTVKLEWRLT